LVVTKPGVVKSTALIPYSPGGVKSMSEVAERLRIEVSQLASGERAELADFLFQSSARTTKTPLFP
jgi:hypothetical protein